MTESDIITPLRKPRPIIVNAGYTNINTELAPYELPNATSATKWIPRLMVPIITGILRFIFVRPNMQQVVYIMPAMKVTVKSI